MVNPILVFGWFIFNGGTIIIPLVESKRFVKLCQKIKVSQGLLGFCRVFGGQGWTGDAVLT